MIKNLEICQKFKTLSKIENFVKNWKLCQKSRQKFVKNWKFRQKLKILSKMEILVSSILGENGGLGVKWSTQFASWLLIKKKKQFWVLLSRWSHYRLYLSNKWKKTGKYHVFFFCKFPIPNIFYQKLSYCNFPSNRKYYLKRYTRRF